MKMTPQQLKLTLQYLYDEAQNITVKELINKMELIPEPIYSMEFDNHIELSHVISVNLAPYI